MSRKLHRKYRLQGAMLALAAGAAVPAAAVAQETVLLDPSVPYDFDKGRNVSVTERGRPDYDQLGIRMGSFQLFPRLETSVGYSDNIYLSDNDKTDAAYLTVAPSLQVNSGWSRHDLRLEARGNFKRYAEESRRNEDGYQFGARGRLDAGLDYSFTGEARYTRQYESPLAGDTVANLAVLSSYNRAYFSGRAERRAGRSRIIASVDYTDLDFNPIELPTTDFDQSYRDRGIVRGIVQAEYAMTPSISFYVQGAHDWTDYRKLTQTGQANLDSRAYRILGGVNFDLSSLMRGTIGIGYVNRDYRSGLYDDVHGLSMEGQLEYFPSELTTITATARRILADATISSANAYFDNRFSLRVDHELLRNLILNATGEVARQNYLNSPINSTNYRISSGGRYLINHRFGIQMNLAYLSRGRNDVNIGNSFDEFSGLITLVYQP